MYDTYAKPVVATLYLNGLLDEGRSRPKRVGNNIENK
jgi:hypothetical protein